MNELLDKLKNLTSRQKMIGIGVFALLILGYFENRYQFTQSWDTGVNTDGGYAPGYGPVPGGNPYNNPGNSPYANPAYNNPMNAGQPGAGNPGVCPPGTMPTQGAPGTIVCVPASGAPAYGPSNGPGYAPPTNPSYGPGAQPGYDPNGGGWQSGGNTGGDVWIDNPRNTDAVTEAGERAAAGTADQE